MRHLYKLTKINAASEVRIDFLGPSTWPSDCSKIRRHRLAVSSSYKLYYFLRSVAEWGRARGMWDFAEAGSEESRTIVICSATPRTDSPMVGVEYVKALDKWSRVSVELYNYFVKEMGPAMELFNLGNLSGKKFYYRPSNQELIFEFLFRSHYYKVDKHLLLPQNLTVTGDIDEVKHKISTFVAPIYKRLHAVLSSVEGQIKTLTEPPHEEGGLVNNDKVKNEILSEVLVEFFGFDKKEVG